MRTYIKDFLTFISDHYEVIGFSDLSEKRNSHIIKQIETKCEKKIFSYCFNKEHFLKSHKSNTLVPDLSLLLNKRSMMRIAYVDWQFEKFV